MPKSANKQREDEMLGYLKTQSKKYNWSGRGFQIFKIEEPFLFAANLFVNGKNNSLYGSLSFKPSCIDNLLCEITGREDYFKNGPLFYKVNSSGMVYPYLCFDFKVDSVNEMKMDNILKEINEKVYEVLTKYSDQERYYEFIKEQKEQKKGSGIQQTFLTNLVYLKKYDELLSYIDYCKVNKIDSGMSQINFQNPDLGWDYYDKLIAYTKIQINSKI